MSQNDDLISRQAAIDALEKAIRNDPYYDSNERINGLGVCDVRVIINDLPPARPKRKKGCKIVKSTGHYGYCACDQCGKPVHPEDKFCSNCGADFREEDT